jgi:hypothetical protein
MVVAENVMIKDRRRNERDSSAESARTPSCAVLVNQFLLNFLSLEPLEPQPRKSSTTSNTSVLIKSILSVQLYARSTHSDESISGHGHYYAYFTEWSATLTTKVWFGDVLSKENHTLWFTQQEALR